MTSSSWDIFSSDVRSCSSLTDRRWGVTFSGFLCEIGCSIVLCLGSSSFSFCSVGSKGSSLLVCLSFSMFFSSFLILSLSKGVGVAKWEDEGCGSTLVGFVSESTNSSELIVCFPVSSNFSRETEGVF